MMNKTRQTAPMPCTGDKYRLNVLKTDRAIETATRSVTLDIKQSYRFKSLKLQFQ